MKKILALLLALTLCFSLCACGESAEEKEKRLAIEQFTQFKEANPYPTQSEDFSEQFIDSELLAQYEMQLETLKGLGITQEECPQIAYAEAVLKLQEYEKYNDFMTCMYQITTIVSTAFDEMADVINAGDSADTTVAFSKFNSAASVFESAEKIVLTFNQDAERVAEIAECVKMLKNGATNIANGIYLNSNMLFSIGQGTVSEQSLVYSVLLTMQSNLIDEVEKIFAELP